MCTSGTPLPDVHRVPPSLMYIGYPPSLMYIGYPPSLMYIGYPPP